MKSAWLEEGYELDGIRRVTAKDWKSMSLKSGQRDKVKRSI